MDLGRAHAETERQMLRTLASVGALAKRDLLVNAARQAGLSEAEAAEVVGAMISANPAASSKQQEQILLQAGRGVPAGFDPSLMASRASRLPAGLAAGDRFDLVLALQKQLGEEAGVLEEDAWQNLTAIITSKLGMTLEEALAAQVAAQQSDIGQAPLARLVGSVKSKEEFYKILNDPKRLAKEFPGARGDKIGLLSPGEIARNARELRSAQQNDLYDQQIGLAAKTPEGRNSLRDYLMRKREAEQNLPLAEQGQDADFYGRAYDWATRESGEGVITRFLMRNTWAAHRMARRYIGGQSEQEAAEGATRAVGGDPIQQLIDLQERQLQEAIRTNNNLQAVGGKPRGVVIDNRHGEN